ncbi:MAG: hypothetical protein RBS55_08495 [Bacteroidales bacterium]|nr:hypothetical protein [Bacteroidales bacterium]
MKTIYFLIFLMAVSYLTEVRGQWNTNGNNIFNTNAGNVGIGNNAPASLLYVGKSMTEPTITVRNLGGAGGATYSMVDDASGANWKFKATNSGGFKIRDFANSLDVFQIEANSAANMLYINATGSVGIGTAAPASSALVDMSSTTQGFLLPRMTQTQISLIQNPANGLMVFNLADNNVYAYVAGAEEWKELSFGTEILPPPFTCGDPITVNHVAGPVAPVNKTVTYYTVTNVPGETTKCWITQNLGSDHQATAVNDATEASAGWYWQFNRMQGYKHDGSTRTPNTTWIQGIDENSDWQTTQNPCTIEMGAGWRIPTWTEWENVKTSGGWTNWNGPWGSVLKMHGAGILLQATGGLTSRGNQGVYWSSTQGTYTTSAINMMFTSSSIAVQYGDKAYGETIRCIKD